jgi:hypothetical protein
LSAAFARFPEFSEIALQAVIVDQPTDGAVVSTCEPILMAKTAKGEWQGLDESDDVLAMSAMLDWSRPVRNVVFRLTLGGAPLIFDREGMSTESIEDRLSEGLPRLSAALASFDA